MSFVKKLASYFPGFLLAMLIAAVAKFLESLLPVPLIGASVIAMFIGMIINGFRKPGEKTMPGIKFTS